MSEYYKVSEGKMIDRGFPSALVTYYESDGSVLGPDDDFDNPPNDQQLADRKIDEIVGKVRAAAQRPDVAEVVTQIYSDGEFIMVTLPNGMVYTVRTVTA